MSNQKATIKLPMKGKGIDWDRVLKTVYPDLDKLTQDVSEILFERYISNVQEAIAIMFMLRRTPKWMIGHMFVLAMERTAKEVIPDTEEDISDSIHFGDNRHSTNGIGTGTQTGNGFSEAWSTTAGPSSSEPSSTKEAK